MRRLRRRLFWLQMKHRALHIVLMAKLKWEVIKLNRDGRKMAKEIGNMSSIPWDAPLQ